MNGAAGTSLFLSESSFWSFFFHAAVYHPSTVSYMSSILTVSQNPNQKMNQVWKVTTTTVYCCLLLPVLQPHMFQEQAVTTAVDYLFGTRSGDTAPPFGNEWVRN